MKIGITTVTSYHIGGLVDVPPTIVTQFFNISDLYIAYSHLFFRRDSRIMIADNTTIRSVVHNLPGAQHRLPNHEAEPRDT